MTVGNTLKNMATAAALVAIRKKYNKPAPERKPKKDDEEREIGELTDKLFDARMNLDAVIDRFIARASKGGVQNSEIIKLTDAINAVAKKGW